MSGKREYDRALIETLPTAFIAIDTDGHYLAFNPAAERLIGARPQPGDVAGHPRYVELFFADGTTPMPREQNPLIRALGGETLESVEVVIKSAEHPRGRHIAACSAPLRDEAGAIVGASVSLQDITVLVEARRRAAASERALERSHKMDAIGRLAGAVAHDFNNLLTVILSYAHMVEPTFDHGDGRATDVAEIRRAAERAAALTRQLLTMSRHGAAQVTRIDPAQIVTGLASPLRRLAGVSIELVIQAGATPAVDADPVQLEQVLINLVVNARDAMPDGGRLVVETSDAVLDADAAVMRGLAAGRYAIIEVTDTGSGMDPDTTRQIFEPYFTTKGTRGTGLGLSIVHGIVTQAGGAVTVYSEPDQGTSFRLFLPEAVGDGERPAAPAEAPPVLPYLTSVRVLIADDDQQVRTVAARILQAAGCVVIEAATAEEARRAFVAEDTPIAVLVTDVVLADGRGDALARQLCDLRPGLRVLMTSGFPASVLPSVRATPGRLLQKPFSPSELCAAVAALIADGATIGEGGDPVDAAEPARTGVTRVLLVDDDARVRRPVARLLALGGFAVTDVDGGRAAIAKLEASPFDVIVSDIEMPGGGGIELLRAVRRIDLDVPVILITGKPDVESASEAIQLGVFRYMTKPLDMAALERAVRHASRVHAMAKIRREAVSVGGNAQASAAADRAGLEVRLDAALETLWLAFQPIFDARTGALYGVEALMRSDEPSMPGPQHVLDAATELGRLYQLGRRIRRLAAAAFASRTDDLLLFVNLHPEDLSDAELIAAGAPLLPFARKVILEVTERASLRSSSELTTRLARLRELGFRLAIDDIGAGYSGLTSFADLIPEVVKVDMSLVRDVHISRVKQRTIRSLCALAHEVGSVVVGEGVETEAERDCLRELGCDLLQGYLLGRPVRELPPNG